MLPLIIEPGQEGFVDGRYMGEVTRLLYDTIYDAYSCKGKSGVEGDRLPKFSAKQAAAGSQGSGGRLNPFYSAVEVVVTGALRCKHANVSSLGTLGYPTEGHPV